MRNDALLTFKWEGGVRRKRGETAAAKARREGIDLL